MSDAARDELIAALNELLEAERAGTKVTLQTAAELADPTLKEQVGIIQHDEAHWCAVLSKAIRRLDGAPSAATGAFHGKAMAIADLGERLVFLNRGQAWVVRRLQALLPEVADAALRADLAAMLAGHEENISLLERQLARPCA